MYHTGAVASTKSACDASAAAGPAHQTVHAAGVQCGEALAQLRKQRLTHDHIETLGTQLVDLHGELDTLQRALTSAHADPLSVVPAPILAAALAAELPPRCELAGFS
jgi:hypothetical protein